MIAGARQGRAIGLALALLGLFAPSAVKSAFSPQMASLHREDRNKLWHLIHDSCAPAASRGIYPPSPCAEVVAPLESARGYAVLKDRDGRYQYLVLPLARIPGIESPALLAPDAPNYFADAWNARLYVEAALHRLLPREELGMVVNSTAGRSQDQLHIHVDCIRPDVRDALRQLLPTMTGHWRPLDLPLPPHRHRYQALWVAGETLSVNPFKMLAASLPASDRMGRHSLVVVGAYSPVGEPGFILLSGRVDRIRRDQGSGDELQDLNCTTMDHPASWSHSRAVADSRTTSP